MNRYLYILIICMIQYNLINSFLNTNLNNNLLNHPLYYEKKFIEWMSRYKKIFNKTEEFFHRLHIFSKNDDYIVKQNKKNSGFLLDHNEFSYLTWSEFRSIYINGLKINNTYLLNKKNKKTYYNNSFNINNHLIPDEIDWVLKGGVTPVKNQGQCGSCWAFSTTGAIEGAVFISNNKLINLSQQELIDCDHNGDMGCGGGLMDHAFKWIKTHGGICKEEDYIYHANQSVCHICENVVQLDEYYDVEPSNEKALKIAVSQQPISVAIEADQPEFQFYKSGVFNSSCGNKLDHGVLIVGYGIENNQKYWKVKNSWGDKWGDNGYIKLAREFGPPEGHCGIASVPSYPKARIINKNDNNIMSKVVDTSSVIIKQCGDKYKASVEFSTLNVLPLSPKRGKPIHFYGSGNIKKNFTNNAIFSLSVKLSGDQVFSHNGNICGNSHISLPLGLGHVDIYGFMNCPIKGNTSFHKIGANVNLPFIAPSGNYEIQINSKDEQEDLFCLHVQLTLTEGKDNNRYPKVYEYLE